MDVVAAPAVALLARRAQREFDHHKVPLMGVMGAFIFAAQMINFPVGNGTSGHLVGGALLAMTLGPAAASIVMTAILATQALIFQDGGLLALGTNVFNMAIAGVWLGYLPFALLRGRKAGIFLGGTISLLASASLAVAELMASKIPMPPAVLAVSSVLFLISALVEGAITLAVVQALGEDSAGVPAGTERVERRGTNDSGIQFRRPGGGGRGSRFGKTGRDRESCAATGVWNRVTTVFHAPLADYQTAFVSSLVSWEITCRAGRGS